MDIAAGRRSHAKDSSSSHRAAPSWTSRRDPAPTQETALPRTAPPRHGRCGGTPLPRKRQLILAPRRPVMDFAAGRRSHAIDSSSSHRAAPSWTSRRDAAPTQETAHPRTAPPRHGHRGGTPLPCNGGAAGSVRWRAFWVVGAPSSARCRCRTCRSRVRTPGSNQR